MPTSQQTKLCRIKNEVDVSTNESFHKSYNHLLMAKNCRDRQLFLFSEFIKYLQTDKVPLEYTTNKPTNMTQPVKMSNDKDELIKGVRRLAEFLQCGTNRANAIAKSGILIREGVQFRLGNANHFHKKKLMELLASKPNLFKDLHWH